MFTELTYQMAELAFIGLIAFSILKAAIAGLDCILPLEDDPDCWS